MCFLKCCHHCFTVSYDCGFAGNAKRNENLMLMQRRVNERILLLFDVNLSDSGVTICQDLMREQATIMRPAPLQQ